MPSPILILMEGVSNQGKQSSIMLQEGGSDPPPLSSLSYHLLRVRIVLFEGLYLALDTPPWVHLNHFTARWFLDCPLSIAMHRLIHRHITAGLCKLSDASTHPGGGRGGEREKRNGQPPYPSSIAKDENEARARIQSNDALNAQFILDHLIPTVTHLPFSHS